MFFNITEKKSKVSSNNILDKFKFVNSAKRLVFDLTGIPFLECLINIYRLIAKVLNDQNLFTESNLVNWFSSYVQFCSGGHFSKRAEAALQCGKMNHLKISDKKTLKHVNLLKVQATKVCILITLGLHCPYI